MTTQALGFRWTEGDAWLLSCSQVLGSEQKRCRKTGVTAGHAGDSVGQRRRVVLLTVVTV